MKKILLVDDEGEIIDLVGIRLHSAGYQVICAMDGEDGLKKVYSEKPDLILLDIVLPKMDGFAVCRSIKGDPSVKNIPVIVLSASGGADLPGRCKDAGADDLIVKPFDAQALLDKIADALKP